MKRALFVVALAVSLNVNAADWRDAGIHNNTKYSFDMDSVTIDGLKVRVTTKEVSETEQPFELKHVAGRYITATTQVEMNCKTRSIQTLQYELFAIDGSRVYLSDTPDKVAYFGPGTVLETIRRAVCANVKPPPRLGTTR